MSTKAHTAAELKFIEGDFIDQPFESWWTHYPNKSAKRDARKAWLQTAKRRPPLGDLIAAVSAQCKWEQWQEGYVPLPATWLRGQRWNDKEPPRPKGKKQRTNEEILGGST